MIGTTPGTPARRPATRRAPRSAAAVLGIAGLLTALLPTAAIAAPAPEPTPTRPAGTLELTLAPVSNGLVGPGEALNVSVTLENGTRAATAPVEVTLSIGSAPLRDRQALTQWLEGDGSGVELVSAGTAALESVEAGTDRVTGIGVAPENPLLSGRAPGVYPLVATAPAGEQVLTSPSAMIVPANEGSAAGMGVLVPVTAGPLTQGLLTAEELEELTAPGGGLTSQLDAVGGTEAILAVDPAITASIRVLGTSAPESASAWLARLEALPNSRFALQFGDADVAAQVQAGLPELLAPASLAPYAEAADSVGPPEPTRSPTTTPAPAPTVDVLDTAQLLPVGPQSRPNVYWPADGTAGPDVVARLGGLLLDDAESLTVVPSTSTAEGADGGTVAARARAGEADLLVYDAGVSEALYEASLLERPSLRGAALTAATAHLAFATADADGPLLVSLGRSVDRSRVGLSTAIATAVAASGAPGLSLDALEASPAGQTDIVEVEVDAARPAAASALVAGEARLAGFATILDDPTLLSGPERAEILQLLGVGWVGDASWAEAVADHHVETDETLNAVGLLPASSNELYGSSAALRFWVRNDLPYAVNLVLYATPDNLRLDVQQQTPVLATPASNTRVEVPVQARVGRGEVTLTLQLRSPALVEVGDPESVDVNVWADWEGYGIGALAVIVGGLLVIGVVRTVLRVRRRRRGGDVPAAPGSAPREATR